MQFDAVILNLPHSFTQVTFESSHRCHDAVGGLGGSGLSALPAAAGLRRPAGKRFPVLEIEAGGRHRRQALSLGCAGDAKLPGQVSPVAELRLGVHEHRRLKSLRTPLLHAGKKTTLH